MLFKMIKTRLCGVLLTGAVLGGVPTAAFAHPHGFRFDVVLPFPPIFVPPSPVVVEPAPARVWVEPVYQTVTERVWVPAVTQTQIQHVDVPAQYGYREVIVRDFFGRGHIRHEQVMISPAHCEDQAVEVVVTPGHFEDQTHQQVVCDGHWQDVR